MHQELFWVRPDIEPVRVNSRRMVLVVPRVQGALILIKRILGVEGELIWKDGLVNPKELLLPVGELVYLPRVALIRAYAFGEGNLPV